MFIKFRNKYSKMGTGIEGIYKGGKIIPLESIDLEENTKVTINVVPSERKKKLSQLQLVSGKMMIKLTKHLKEFLKTEPSLN